MQNVFIVCSSLQHLPRIPEIQFVKFISKNIIALVNLFLISAELINYWETVFSGFGF